MIYVLDDIFQRIVMRFIVLLCFAEEVQCTYSYNVISGEVYNIPDSSLLASSYYDNLFYCVACSLLSLERGWAPA